MTGPAPSPGGNTLLGSLLVASGLLMFLLCGGCTFYMLQGAMSDMANPTARSDAELVIAIALVVGGTPTVIGGIAVAIGVLLLRRKAPPKP